VGFFDNSGKRLSRLESSGRLEDKSLDVPILRTASKDVVLTLDSRKLLEIPRVPVNGARLIGTKLFVTEDERQAHWRQYDLHTGAAGKPCDTEVLGYFYTASDGNVAIGLGERAPWHAVDLETCETLWSIPLPYSEIGRVNTTLVLLDNDEISSLVAP
jgi:hypothetical protein